METKVGSKEYWEENIQGWSGFYDKKSEEALQGPRSLTSLYKKIIFPLEEKYMRQRFDMVSAFIAKNIRPKMNVADIGCGCGIYTKHMASLGAKVFAIDFTQSALDLTKNNLTTHELECVELHKFDVVSQPIPRSDVSIAIGVMPYVDKIDSFLNNILPFTNCFYFNFLNADSWLNIVRHKFPVFDVRGYYYYSVSDLRKKLAERNFEIVDMKKLATGFMIEAKKITR